jgi:hypothetical protein
MVAFQHGFRAFAQNMVIFVFFLRLATEQFESFRVPRPEIPKKAIIRHLASELLKQLFFIHMFEQFLFIVTAENLDFILRFGIQENLDHVPNRTKHEGGVYNKQLV